MKLINTIIGSYRLRRPWITREEALLIAADEMGPDEWAINELYGIIRGLFHYRIGIRNKITDKCTSIVINAYTGKIYLRHIYMLR